MITPIKSRVQQTLVIALGNALCGDDGAGKAILNALATTPDLPKEVTLLDCSRGGLLNAIFSNEGARIIIIDAADMGHSPGEWARFTPREVTIHSIDLGSCGSLHNASLAEALALAAALEFKIPEILIFGIQPLKTDYSTEISQPVRKVIPDIQTAIIAELS